MRRYDDPDTRISTLPNLPFGGCFCIQADGSFIAESQPRTGVEAMTDKKSIVDRVRDHATDDDSPHAH